MNRYLCALLAFCAPAAAAPEVAFTFDDLPAHSVLPAGMTRMEIAEQTIAALKEAGLPPVYGLVNGALTAAEPDAAPVLNRWREAGNLLGNHTWSHPNLAQLSVADYTAEIVRNEDALAELSGTADWRWFRYPFLSEGETAQKRDEVRSVLAARGYKIAPATMMFGDWLYSEPYARCLAKQDEAAIARMESLYLTAAADHIDYYRAISQARSGRDIPYVLLLHIGSFEAHMLPKLIALYKTKGFSFVTLDQAEADPYYKPYTDPSQPAPLSDAEVFKAKGVSEPAKPDMHTAELAAMCR